MWPVRSRGGCTLCLAADPRCQPSMIRSEERSVALHERVLIAHRRNADRFVSIHADAARSRTNRRKRYMPVLTITFRCFPVASEARLPSSPSTSFRCPPRCPMLPLPNLPH
ncbi:N-acetylmuramoyl-L-alanine amidase [Xanthomonas arboricola]